MKIWRGSKSSQRSFTASGIISSIPRRNCSSYYFALPESLVVELASLLFRAVAAIGAFLPVRETIEAAVAAGFSRYRLEIHNYGLQPSTDLFLEGVTLQLSDQLLVLIKVRSGCHSWRGNCPNRTHK